MNKNGFSAPVDKIYEVKGGLVVPERPKMPKLVKVSESRKHVTIRWGKSDNGLQYELLWNEGKVGAPASTLIVRGKMSEYKVPISMKPAEYRFAVKVLNLCGASSPSKELLVSLKAPLHQMSPLTTIASGCTIRFQWIAPSHYEQNDVDNYDIEVKTKSGWQMLPKALCGKGREVFCVVPMTVLQAKPYEVERD